MSPKQVECKIFISYARKDIQKVRRLCLKLKKTGFNPWIDIKNIVPGEDWMQAIKSAIREAHFFIACLSKNSIDKRGVLQYEINEALDMWRQKLSTDIFLIPIKLEECLIPSSMSKFQVLNLYQSREFSRLKDAIIEGMKRLGIINILHLRSKPNHSLTEKAVIEMLQSKDFFCNVFNPKGRGIKHKYELIENEGCKLVIDYITNLIWQQSGSSNWIDKDEVKHFITDLNTNIDFQINSFILLISLSPGGRGSG